MSILKRYTSTDTWEPVQGSTETLPSQNGNAGKFLQTNGTTVSWQPANIIYQGGVAPSNPTDGMLWIDTSENYIEQGVVTSVNGQSGPVIINAGLINAIPEPAIEGNNGQFLMTNGYGSRSWSSAIHEPTSEGQNGDILKTDGNGGRSWVTPSYGYMELIWENPSPSSGFAAQTLVSSSSGWGDVETLVNYNYLIVVQRSTNSGTVYATGIIFNDNKCYVVINNNLVTSSNTFNKRGYTVSNDSIIITTGYQNTSEGTSYAIPIKIYGVRV